MRRSTVALITAGIAALAVCGSVPTASARVATKKAPKPCAVLTADEVSTAIERPVGAPKKSTPPPAPPGAKACEWTATETQGEIAERTVKVEIWDFRKLPAEWKRNLGTKAAKYVKQACAGSESLGVPPGTKVSAGNAACQVAFLTYVAKGPILLAVSVPNISGDPAAAAASRTLAIAGADRI